jgi:20S proteasome subunit beta 5
LQRPRQPGRLLQQQEHHLRELGRRAIFQATFRDAYSGGTVSVYHVTEKGWEKVSGDDCYDLYLKYNPEAQPAAA